MKNKENFCFDNFEEEVYDTYFVLIIYDIVSDKRRNRLVKLLKGYGERVQKSAFEAHLKKTVFNKLLKELEKFAKKEDSIRVYKIIGKGQTFYFGTNVVTINEESIII